MKGLDPLTKTQRHCSARLCVQVLEEVDVHVILSTCPKLERLVLSGCGNTVPPTCPGFDCKALRLKRLRLLFFADGDDYSWDHAVPPCFWRAALAAGRQTVG